MGRMISGSVVAVLSVMAGGVAAAPAVAELPESPCQNAWMEPRSDLADRCRDKGWVVWERLVVTPRKAVVYYTIPACRTTYPDGKIDKPTRPLPCYYGFGGDQSETMFYVTRNKVRHYVETAR